MTECSRLPLTAAQRELWLAQETVGLKMPNIIFEWFVFDGNLDTDLFRRSVALGFGDFQTFNTRYVTEGGFLYQEIDPTCVPTCPLVDLTQETDFAAAMERWIAEDRARLVHPQGINHCAMPLFRRPDGRYTWCVQVLHIASDGYTGMLWAQWISEIYSALCAGLPVPKKHFGSLHDLLHEEQSYRVSSQYERDRSYWREVTATRGAAVTLSTQDRCNGDGTITQPVKHSEALHSQLDRKSRETKIPLSSFLLALAAIYIFRVTGESKFTIGYPVTARVNRTLRNTPGSLSCILPLTLTVDPEQSLTELAESVTSNVKRLFRHQRYRVEDIRRDLALLPQDPPL